MKKHKNKRIFFDYAASTPVSPEVEKAMRPYWHDLSAHPWSTHLEGRKAKEVVEDARKTVARFLNASSDEITFTGSGTHANTLALKGVLEGALGSGHPHIIVSAVEHPSVGAVKTYAKQRGVDVDVLPVTSDGIVDVSILPSLLREETRLVSIMFANSEIGTIQPIKKISHIIRKHNQRIEGETLFHSDATQAAPYLPIDVRSLGIDLLTIDGHKMYGPKGIAALFVRRGVRVEPLLLGSGRAGGSKGAREQGTPPTPLIHGLAKTVEEVLEKQEERTTHTRSLQMLLFDLIEDNFPKARINGSKTDRLPSNVSISFNDVDHEYLQVLLDENGIAVATRSACLELGEEGSHVIAATAGEGEKNATRITFGEKNTEEEVRELMRVLGEVLSLAKRR